MPKLPTAEEVFGSRPTPRAQRNIVGYDTSAISQANIRAGQTIENAGQGMVQLGVNLLDEKERGREKAERERERAEAKLERENLKSDSILEARARSDYLLKALELKERVRSDPTFKVDDGLAEFSKIKQNYAGGFKTPEGAAAFDVYDRNTLADLKYDLGGVILQRQQNAFLADLDDQDAKLAVAMSQSKDLNEIAEISKVRRRLNQSKRAIPGINEDELRKRDRSISQEIGLAYYNALTDEEKQRVLFGDEYYDSEKPAGADYTSVVRSIESAGSGDLEAQNPNSTAKGRYQWIDSTARKYGLLGKDFDYRGDAEKEEAAFKQFTEDNRVALNSALGRMPTDAELYLAHQQGAGGAAKLLSDPDAKAIDVVGGDAVLLNGGNEDMTAGEFANKWISKYEEKAGAVSQSYKGTPLEVLDYDTIGKLRETFKSEMKAKEKAALDALEIPKLTKIQNENELLSSIVNNTALPAQEKIIQIRKADLAGSVRSEWASNAVALINAQKPIDENIPPEQKAAAFLEASDLQRELYFLAGENGENILSPNVLGKFEKYRDEVFKRVSDGRLTPSEGQKFLEGVTNAIDSAIEAKKTGGDNALFSAPGINDYNYYALQYVDQYLKNIGHGSNVALKRDIFSKFSSYLPNGEYKSTGNWVNDEQLLQVAVSQAIKATNIRNYIGKIDPENPPNAVIPTQNNVRTEHIFATEDEVDAANLEDGTIVSVGGKLMRYRK